MSDGRIRVGIIGAGGWAKYGHIPALQALKDDFEIVAVASRKKELAEEYKAKFNLLHAFDDTQALIACPDVDLVVIWPPPPNMRAWRKLRSRREKMSIANGHSLRKRPTQKNSWTWPNPKV